MRFGSSLSVRLLLASVLLVACHDPIAVQPGNEPDASEEHVDAGESRPDAASSEEDAGLPDAGGETDAGEAIDAGHEEPDAGGSEEADAGESVDAGFTCRSDAECAGGFCFEGACMTGCATDDECPAGGWTCTNVEETVRECVCTSTGSEVCNGLDDDCSGAVDDGATCSGDLACVAGACRCPEGLACGDLCVDDRADPNHCGGCQHVCGPLERCTDGVCTCPTEGCEDVPECSAGELAVEGCGACLAKCAVARERDGIEGIADAFRTFRADTGGWPWEGSSVDVSASFLGGVDPTPFLTSDTALFTNVGLPVCPSTDDGGFCWGGPYLQPGPSMASPPWHDAWGRVRMFAIIPPAGTPGGHVSAPDGAVVIWSRGPDGLDHTGCLDGCARDLSRLVRGEPSLSGVDDIIVLVGNSR